MEVIGVIIAIERDFSDNPYINLAAEASGRSVTNVWCRFAKDNASSLAKVDKSLTVTIQGICDGIDGDVYLKDCKVIKISSEPIPENNDQKQSGNWFTAPWVEGDSILYEKCVIGKGSSLTHLSLSIQ